VNLGSYLPTPSGNGLTGGLLNDNPNGNYSINPFRLDRSQAVTCDMNHGYTAEQQVYHGGLDKFVEHTGSTQEGCTDIHHKRLVMGYFDGNTVTALWNYAQHYAINDNSFGTVFGPSTLGALNLISGTTVGGLPRTGTPGIVNGTVVSDLDPKMDDCSGKGVRIQMKGKNIGNLLYVLFCDDLSEMLCIKY
jgi:phospholipase C